MECETPHALPTADQRAESSESSILAAKSESEDEEDECKPENEKEDIAEALRLSEQDHLERRRGDNKDDAEGLQHINIEIGSLRKRSHTKAEDDVAQAAAKAEASRIPETEDYGEGEEDDCFLVRPGARN